MTNRPGGFSEAGICTDDIEAWVAFLTAIGGYRERWRGAAGPDLAALWGLPAYAHVSECLLVREGFEKGGIRLFRVEGVPQVTIREGCRTWDSGGIFDLDLRVGAVRGYVEQLESHGWNGVSSPIDWPFGDLEVREWLAAGPDAVVFALVQRLRPPLAETESLQGFSPVFNSSQIVSDMERSLAFYRELGFREVVRHRGPLGGRGGEVLGLTPEEAPATAVDLAIVHPDGVVDGSVELVAFEDRPGHDVSGRALPSNRGLNLLRFPVVGLPEYAAQLQRAGVPPAAGPLPLRIEPHGLTEAIVVRTPDGAWLEFYEAFPATRR